MDNLDAILKDESKKKIFFTFKNEKVEKLEFYERWCPDNHVCHTSKGKEEEIETENKAGEIKISTRDFFAGIVRGKNSGFGYAAELNATF